VRRQWRKCETTQTDNLRRKKKKKEKKKGWEEEVRE
jgi:hypothetical protein